MGQEDRGGSERPHQIIDGKAAVIMATKQENAAALFLLGDSIVGVALCAYGALCRPLPSRFVKRDFGYFLLMAAIPVGLALLATLLLILGLLWAGARSVRGGPWLPLILGVAHLPMLFVLRPLGTLMTPPNENLLFLVAWAAWPVLIARWPLTSAPSTA
jgi:hypothetical protein